MFLTEKMIRAPQILHLKPASEIGLKLVFLNAKCPSVQNHEPGIRNLDPDSYTPENSSFHWFCSPGSVFASVSC